MLKVKTSDKKKSGGKKEIKRKRFLTHKRAVAFVLLLDRVKWRERKRKGRAMGRIGSYSRRTKGSKVDEGGKGEEERKRENEARSAILDFEFRENNVNVVVLHVVVGGPPQARPRHDPTTPSKAI